jgi:hypothetical protein
LERSWEEIGIYVRTVAPFDTFSAWMDHTLQGPSLRPIN